MERQREFFYQNSGLNFDVAWQRPLPDKWSIDETMYHLVLMVRMFRRFSVVYVPAMLPVALLRKKKPYKTEIHDIYKEYNQQKKRPMNAPFLIKPPSNVSDKWRFEDIKDLLELETARLKSNLKNIEEDVAGQIYYPDPIAGYPNLVQCIHLLAIHEQHHFNLVKKYEDAV
ncbi:DinB family protein [Virgibacillus doumboii]|uniref:DinB family protein n=1 Tax=Virgibacillus doumboii TaxID=2697503 RepID=UPI0013E09179|nr:DinB family protein [Virgibacillus doumboii]